MATELTQLGARKLVKHLFGENIFSPGRLQATVTDGSKNSLGGSTPVPTDWNGPSTSGSVVSAGSNTLITVGASGPTGRTTYDGVGLKDVSGTLILWEDVTTAAVGRPYSSTLGVDFPAESLRLAFNFDNGYSTDSGGALTMTAAAVQQLLSHLLSASDTGFPSIAFNSTVTWDINLLDSAGNAVSTRAWDRVAGEATYVESADCSYYANVGDLSFPGVVTTVTVTDVSVSIGGVEFWRMGLASPLPLSPTSSIKIPAGQIKCGLKYIS